MTFPADSYYGRFVGAQFDLANSLQYQDEVLLVVRAKVSEKVLRQTATGTTREISVLRAEDVFIADGPQSSTLRSVFGIRGEDAVPELGAAVDMPVLTPVEVTNLDAVHVVDPEVNSPTDVSTDVEDDRQPGAGLARRTRISGRDKHLDRFLESVER